MPTFVTAAGAGLARFILMLMCLVPKFVLDVGNDVNSDVGAGACFGVGVGPEVGAGCWG